jgi:hypothetical protein
MASGNYRRHHIPGLMADTPQPCQGAMAVFHDREQGPVTNTLKTFLFISSAMTLNYEPEEEPAKVKR